MTTSSSAIFGIYFAGDSGSVTCATFRFNHGVDPQSYFLISSTRGS